MTDLQTLHITLQPDGVAGPAQRAIALATQVVGTCLRALDADDCTEPLSWGGSFGYKFADLDLPPDERRQAFQNWVLARGFQDLTRGVRETLEEAVLFLAMMERESGVVTTLAQIESDIANTRASAAKLTFPALLDRVNTGLKEPTAFDAEFRSLQKVRNCLEHRGGRVAQKDVDPATGTLTLTFRRLKTFYLRGDDEIELAAGEVIDTHALDSPFGKEEISICMRLVTRSREYGLGEPVIISAPDFWEIAMACHIFAGDVATKLPADVAARK